MTAKVSPGGWGGMCAECANLDINCHFFAQLAPIRALCVLFSGVGLKYGRRAGGEGLLERCVCVCVWRRRRRRVGSGDLPGSCAAGGAVSPPGGVAQRDGTAAAAAAAEAATAAPGAGAAMFVRLRGSSAVYVHQRTSTPSTPHLIITL